MERQVKGLRDGNTPTRQIAAVQVRAPPSHPSIISAKTVLVLTERLDVPSHKLASLYTRQRGRTMDPFCHGRTGPCRITQIAPC